MASIAGADLEVVKFEYLIYRNALYLRSVIYENRTRSSIECTFGCRQRRSWTYVDISLGSELDLCRDSQRHAVKGESGLGRKQVFNAETFIIGLCAGVMGIMITLLILLPGNALIHHLAGTRDISAVLPAVPAVILIVLSIVLTLIGGIIPSRKAAKSDPVTALRTE